MSTRHVQLAGLRTRWSAVGAAVAITLGAGGIGLAQAAIEDGDKPVTITVEPERILDTRDNLGLTGAFASETPRDLQVTGDVDVASGAAKKTVVPAGASAVLVNVTAVNPSGDGFLSLRPAGATGAPSTSTVNFGPGTVEPNAATVDLSADGKIQIYAFILGAAPSVHVLVDVVGYTVDHNHNDLYYTEAEVDAAFLPQGEIVMSHGAGAFGNPASAVQVFGQSFSNTTGSGFGNMPIDGPTDIGGVDYGLKSIEYCLTILSAPTFITDVTVSGSTNLGSGVTTVSDSTDRTANDCYSITVNDSTSTSFIIAFQFGGGAGSLRIYSVTSTWAPAASLPASAATTSDLSVTENG